MASNGETHLDATDDGSLDSAKGKGKEQNHERRFAQRPFLTQERHQRALLKKK